MGKLDGKVALITGAGGGIGSTTARLFAREGAAVVLADVALDPAEAAAQAIKDDGGQARAIACDVSDESSVRAAVETAGPLDILVNNAGVMATPETRTAYGWELQFAVNHLGHFALAVGLHDALAAAGHARVVSVSSVGHINGDIDFDDLFFTRRPYDPWTAYAQSKTANVLFAVEAARLWKPDGIAVNALNPGRIADTGLGRHLTPASASFDPAGRTGVSVKNIAQGAATSVLLAASPLVEGVTGQYFEDLEVAGPYVPGIRRGVAAYALDPDRAKRLWQVSLDLIDAR
jgi:NAD(P)-dependent dehydrogenase (short-subunit alcohol dehydrogenase family)